jgi:HAD superfamily hydrolase (TIGR01509 family)
MITAVIFDLDGLLLDSEVYWERARREYAQSLACQWSEQDELGVKGKNSREWAADILARCPGHSIREIIDGVTARMQALYRQHLPLLPGAVQVVRALAAEYPLALASSSPPVLIQEALTDAGIRTCFRATVSSDDVGKGKPAPDVFLAAGRALGRPPAEIAVFEDSSAGIEAARAAGMRVIAVPNPHYPPSPSALASADRVLTSLVGVGSDTLRSL